MKDPIPAMRERARMMREFADGVEAGGAVDYARRARVIVADLVDALEAWAAERSARQAIQVERDRLRKMLTPGA